MSEETLNKSIIHKASRDQLMQWCLDRNITVETEETRTSLQDKLRTREGLKDLSTAKSRIRVFKEAPNEDPEKVFRKVKIRIASEGDDSQPVFAGLNGTSFVIQRDRVAEVPFCVYQVIANALTDRYNPRTMEVSRVPLYPVQLLSN